VIHAVINAMAALAAPQFVMPVQILESTPPVAVVQKGILITELLSAFSVSYSVNPVNTSQMFVLLAEPLVLMPQPVIAHKVLNFIVLLYLRLFYRLKLELQLMRFIVLQMQLKRSMPRM
jgi:hypothetical protein